MISTQNELIDLCNDLQHCTAVAIDTEFTRTNTYWPILSIVQLSDGKNCYVVDFQKDSDTSLDPAPLIALLLNLNVTKIIHSCRQDFEIFQKEWGIIPQNIFDTQVAANLLFPSDDMGLARLLKQELDVDLNKAQQNTDWSRRPLSPQQLTYALSDVEHLHNLWDCLGNKLESKGRLGWLWEDQSPLLTEELYIIDRTAIWKKVKSGKSLSSLTPRALLFLKYICQWRETKAQSKNLNRGRIITDEVAVTLAQTPPETLDGFAHDWGHLKNEFILELWDVFHQANQLPRELWPTIKKGPALSGRQSLLLEKIREYHTKISYSLEIAPRILSNNDDLKEFCTGSEDVGFLRGWRYQEFGRGCEKLR